LHFSPIGLAVVRFQYSERLKSELIIASNLLNHLEGLSGEKLAGAEDILLLFLNAIANEAEMAETVSKHTGFRNIKRFVEAAAKAIKDGNLNYANRNIAEAVSVATTCGQEAIERLIKEGIF